MVQPSKCLLFFLFVAMSGETAFAEELKSNITCECGVFRSPTSPVTAEKPIISKAPKFAIECNEEGKASCVKMCNALAEASREKAPQVICELVKDAREPVVPIVYSRSCGEKEWSYTGLTSTLKICCQEKAPASCLQKEDDEP